MQKAGFFLGGSLCMGDESTAEEALSRTVTPQDWRRAYATTIQSLKERVANMDQSAGEYDAAFPETVKLNPDRTRMLLSPVECKLLIQQSVLFGLLWGLLFPELMSVMLRTWIDGGKQPSDIKVGGLKVEEHPLMTSAEQAYEAARSMYQSWLQSCS